jgi:hypothetical protein
MKIKSSHITIALSLFIAFVFIQSLFFKFTNAPDTQHIFGTLDTWAGSLGFPGLFRPGGIFSAIMIGCAELFASLIFLLALVPKFSWLRPFAALISLAIISGAIFFHLFTPLGVVINGDHGTLFTLACGVWISSVAIIVMERHKLRVRFNGG